jgi:hypothetical protein
VRFDRNRTAIGKILNSPETERALVARAGPMAEQIRARTPEDSGETAASTRVEPGHRNAKGDRIAVRIVQDGAALQLQYGHGNTRAIRHMTSGF